MKRGFYIIIILSFLLSSLPGFSQYMCNDTSIIMDRKGKWTHGTDVIHDNEISAIEKKEVFNRIDSIFDLLKEVFPQPIGCQPRWYRSVESRKNKSPETGGLQPYSFNSLYLKYYCDKRLKDLQLETNTGTWAWIFANHLPWFVSKSDSIKINGKQLYVRAGYKGEINGMPIYESFNNGKALLFSRPGELPYTPVTRRQYLEMELLKWKGRKSKNIENIMKTKIRSEVEQEAEKQKELDKIDRLFAKYPEKKVEEAKQRYLKGFKTDEQRRDENLKRSNDYYDREIKKYQDELNNTSPELLESPACLGKGKNILGDEKEGGLMFVTLNEKYINKKLASTVPQYFVMVLTINDKHIAARHLTSEIVNRFPFHKLQSMIR